MANNNSIHDGCSVRIELPEIKSMLKEVMKKVSSLSAEVYTLKVSKNICEMHRAQK